MTKVKVLFVCLGNICRSPLAEGIFRFKVKERDLGHLFHIDSCGTSDFHIGEKPDERSLSNAKKNGVDYMHRGRQLKVKDFYDFDYIFPMDDLNLRDVHALKPSDAKAVVMKMRSFDDESTDAEVPDPYYQGDDGFQLVFDILDHSAEKLLNELIQRHQLA